MNQKSTIFNSKIRRLKVLNFNRALRRNRKAISPVLATVILIAITLIAAVAIAGFVFGLFGSFTKTAQVQASSVACSATGKDCALSLINSGNANTATAGECTITYSGATYQGTLTGGGSVVAGGSLSVTCTAPVTAPAGVPGGSVTGSVTLTNGGTDYYSGSF